jgi:hypothetical protein
MNFSSSEDEERSIIGVFPEALPCSNTSEQGRRDETFDETPVVAEIRMAPAVEFWRHRAEDFPLRRESIIV